ncbi:MAG: CDP-diacylglycerol--serine O-phosphatidyltransferase [Silvanigrellaceae bacterium]|nr:CDP-diacylglycerol--serine O-phosphatidyltransferase [Silvanigrellaceae bacterium]
MTFIRKNLKPLKHNHEPYSSETTTTTTTTTTTPPPPTPFAQSRKKGMKSTIYLLPNLITALSLFFGFLSMRFSMEGVLHGSLESFAWAAYAILAAGICDGLDGSVARLTQTQSSFGGHLDSLCDLISFGVAPAFLAYNFALKDLGRLGFAAAFIFIICGALRLARFNVQNSLGKASGNFTGIPIPMGAVPIAIFVLAQIDLKAWDIENGYNNWSVFIASFLTQTEAKNYSLLMITFLLALGMISTFEYLSTKKIRLPARRPFRVFAFVLILFALLTTLQLVVTLTLLSLVYCIHGPLLWMFTKRDKADEEDEIFEAGEDS